ncbi:MAG: ATP-dependent 6-phosphofructokinase [Saccharopolyspora sp.]|uniref:ATP-dependent 6-phosphofructokinase n=1 Tax=Saccharopolyspora TaxID=1835 RepID=UPI00190D06A6|nr:MULTISPECIES: ATP-dependent 6-phosphofructokinase [unclassified Saccharopolyspora]MBK0869121.1 ATP-dependent 6-phosphofructokinase [Saccharopolyspora sp. HNM0986]MBQ6644326.1 ATP-dependent 6-phosphofructokinase [Saccharopolyspora sp.]
MKMHLDNLRVRHLGECRYDSPFCEMLAAKRTSPHYVAEGDRVLLEDTVSMLAEHDLPPEELPSFEAAGPRRKIYFDSSRVTAGVVTCGGLCPGLNDVIRGIVQELTVHYGVRRILGFRNGLRGLTAANRDDTEELTPDRVREIHNSGGTILGSSRGGQEPEEMVDSLVLRGVDALFVIGGDGGMRAATNLAAAIRRRGLDIAVIGVPKTIDNDLPYTDQSFGFQSAFAQAANFIDSVAIEAAASPDGIGIVKLMGRHSGFIACYASLARNAADVVLIPEVPFALEGPDGLLARVERHVREKGFVVVVVAEGAGQELLQERGLLADTTDPSGNARLGDIGALLRETITAHLIGAGLSPTVRYIDPSYAVRSVTANAYDSVYCLRLAHAAVHAAMAGRTETAVVRWRRRFVHVPMPLIISHRNEVDPDGDLWMSVLEATGHLVPRHGSHGRPDAEAGPQDYRRSCRSSRDRDGGAGEPRDAELPGAGPVRSFR